MFRDWLMFAAFAVVSTIALAIVDLRPIDAKAGVAVIFPPWTGGASAIARATAAGSAIVRLGRYPFIVIVQPATSGFVGRALRRGAVAVLDPGVLGGCLVRTSDPL